MLTHTLETMPKHFAKVTAAFIGFALIFGVGQVALADDTAPVANPTDAPVPIATPIAEPVPVTAPAPITVPLSGAASVRPAKVTNLIAADNQPTQLTLTWEQPAVANAESISDYRVTYKFDDFGGWITWKHPVTTDQRVIVPNLPMGVGISFAIRPVTANFVGLAAKLHLLTPAPAAPQLASLQQRNEYAFVAANWNSRAVNRFGYYPGRDCANWASQALLRRGFVQTAKWHGRSSRLHGSSMAWISSTKLREYLQATGKVTVLTDAQRAQVQVGDLVQFDWWNTGMQEHTGIVSAIIASVDGPKIYYASHTAHGMWWSVDRSIHVSYPGATVSYLHVN